MRFYPSSRTGHELDGTLGIGLTRRCCVVLVVQHDAGDRAGLQRHLVRYLDAVETGEILDVRRRRGVIARVVPYEAAEPAEPWPDLMERLAGIYPDGPIAESAAEQLCRDRDRSDSNTSVGVT